MPTHAHSSSNTTEVSGISSQQPLYANAPPKPKRLNEGYSSPSPDILDVYHPYVPPPAPQSPYDIQQSKVVNKMSNYYYTGTPPLEYIPHMYPAQNERRTPDTYGRSKQTQLGIKQRHLSDYEDIYADQCMYKRPLSPLACSNVKKTPIPGTFTPVNILGPKDTLNYLQPLEIHRKSNVIPRPHSADFLEHESERPKQPRPKSSLEINTPSLDNYFYSEQRYAEKMRKSAQFLPRMNSNVQSNFYTVQQKSPQFEYDYTFPLTKSNTQPINLNSVEFLRKEQPVRSRSVLSENSLCKEFQTSNDDIHMESEFKSGQKWTKLNDYDQYSKPLSVHSQNVRGKMEKSLNVEGERKVNNLQKS